MPTRRGRPRLRWAFALLPALIGCVALAGCSELPYAPGPSVVPSPSPASPAPASAPADLDLSGDVETVDGLSFHVHSEIWFGEVVSALPAPGRAPVGWTEITRTARGETTVTNTSARPNAAAATTLYDVYAGYPRSSEVCRLASRDQVGQPVGERCWLRLGTSSPYSYGRGEHPGALEPGTSRTAGFDARPPDALDAPAAAFDQVATLLQHPSDLVVVAHGIDGLHQVAYRHACSSSETTPRQRWAIVGASSALRCEDVPAG